MRLVPVPIDFDALKASAPLWLPFLPSIARRTKETVPELIRKVTHFEVRLTLILRPSSRIKPCAPEKSGPVLVMFVAATCKMLARESLKNRLSPPNRKKLL